MGRLVGSTSAGARPLSEADRQCRHWFWKKAKPLAAWLRAAAGAGESEQHWRVSQRRGSEMVYMPGGRGMMTRSNTGVSSEAWLAWLVRRMHTAELHCS
jgi:hypothetical protein